MTTIEEIKAQRQLVATLQYKKERASDAYLALIQAKSDACAAVDLLRQQYDEAYAKLKSMGRDFATDLSETCYTPEIGEADGHTR